MKKKLIENLSNFWGTTWSWRSLHIKIWPHPNTFDPRFLESLGFKDCTKINASFCNVPPANNRLLCTGSKSHICGNEKSIELLKNLISAWCPLERMISDSFAGTCTTATAATFAGSASTAAEKDSKCYVMDFVRLQNVAQFFKNITWTPILTTTRDIFCAKRVRPITIQHDSGTKSPQMFTDDKQ